MSDIAQTGLKEPDQVDWDKVGGSKYVAPPPAKSADGRFIVYTGQLPNKIDTTETDDDGYRQYVLDPITLVKNGQGVDGVTIRFARVGLKPWKNGNNGTALLIKATGVASKPQSTADYDKAIGVVRGKVAPLTIDWQARDKNTGETVRGYDNFPEDPQRPGFKKAILKQGDTYKDENGVEQTVKADVLFANAQLRFFEAGGRK